MSTVPGATDTAPGGAPKYTKKDFESDQDVRWCPGCGDYAILSAVQKTMPDLGIPKEDIVPGDNTIEFVTDNIATSYPPLVHNIDLLLDVK